MTYAEAMNRFGTDKPDLRFGQELVELTDYFAKTPFRVFQADYVGAVVMPGGAGQPRKQLDAWQEFARQRGHRGLAYVLVGEDGELGGPVAKNLSESERSGLAAEVGAAPGDCIFFAAGPRALAQSLLGATRLEIGRSVGLINENAWAFCWVVDAPLFEPASVAMAAGDVTVGAGAWTAVHHAFTAPQDLENFDTDPGSALAYAYDIVCNGNEIGGGSIRIHRRDIQERVFAVMGLAEGGGAGEVRLLAGCLQLRPAAAWRHRLRLGPDLRSLVRNRLDPRRDRLSEDRRRRRSTHRRPSADHRRAAQGGRNRRPARRLRGRASEVLAPQESATACSSRVISSTRLGRPWNRAGVFWKSTIRHWPSCASATRSGGSSSRT